MIIKVFSVFDKKAAVFMPPFYFSAAGQAVRQFTDWCNDKSLTVGRYSSDFELYQLGVFDDSNGSFECGAPTFVVAGSDVVKEG